jgi:hypothetical protein
MRGRAWWATAVVLLTAIALMPAQSSIADDPFPPEVRGIYPDDGRRLEPRQWTIEVNFTEAMNLTTMEDALVIDPHVEYDHWFGTLDNTTFFYRITLVDGTYQFSLADTVEDVNGTRMASPLTWSYTVGEDEPEDSSVLSWVGWLPGTLPIVLILAVWYIYDKKNERRLPPQYQKRLEEIRPKTFDLYTIGMLSSFAAVLALILLYIAYEMFILLVLAGSLALVVGAMALIGFVFGIASKSSATRQVEMEAYGYPPARPQVVQEPDRLHSVQIGLTVTIGFLAYFAFLVMLPSYGGSFDPYPLLFFIPAFAVLAALYIYVSRLRRSG